MHDNNHLNCLICNRQLENFDPPSGIQPLGGLNFFTYGHYGSAVFDPMDGSRLDIVICDECVAERAERVRGDGLGNLDTGK